MTSTKAKEIRYVYIPNPLDECTDNSRVSMVIHGLRNMMLDSARRVGLRGKTLAMAAFEEAKELGYLEETVGKDVSFIRITFEELTPEEFAEEGKKGKAIDA